jgi:hypothetical protein
MEQRWNESGREKPKYSEKNLSQYQFAHHKSHMEWLVRGQQLTAWAMARTSSFLTTRHKHMLLIV